MSSVKQQHKVKFSSFLRVLYVGLLVIGQIVFAIALSVYLREHAFVLNFIIEVCAVVVIVLLMNHNENNSYVHWILIIAFLPVFGFILYATWGRSNANGKHNEKIRTALRYGSMYRKEYISTHRVPMEEENYPLLKEAHFLQHHVFPCYQNTKYRYFSQGERLLAQQLKELKEAKRFIFIEYFIVNVNGKLWDAYYDVLKQKAAEGVEVRFLFDDFGSLFTVPDNFESELEAAGIKAARFNPVHHYINRLYMNFRNHQKITVIDGNVGFVGGTNLSDEYANLTARFGHWKDTGLRLEGDAVWGLTLSFLEMWDGTCNVTEPYDPYRPSVQVQDQSLYIPYVDGPTNNANIAEDSFAQMIANADSYVYISTPYLVIDSDMIRTLCTAARSGVDVRLVTPHRWDKWYVHMVTQSNYRVLLKAGVKVYEYTPGFLHAKTLIADGKVGVMGSVNMDYRSFRLHYENAVWFYNPRLVSEIHEDFLNMIAISKEIDLEELSKTPMSKRLFQSLLRLFAPLL